MPAVRSATFRGRLRDLLDGLMAHRPVKLQQRTEHLLWPESLVDETDDMLRHYQVTYENLYGILHGTTVGLVMAAARRRRLRQCPDCKTPGSRPRSWRP